MKCWKILIFILLIYITGCDSKDNRLIIGIIKPSLNHFPLDFAFSSGYLNRDSYVIKNFASGWETNEALVAGRIDVAILPFTYIWTDISQGKKVKIISFLERESDGIIARKDITKIQDLDGKKIGVLRASTLDIFAEIMADDYNISLELVYFRTPMDMAAALQAGEVDALSFYVPSIFRFNENFKIIYWFGEDYPLHTCCDLAVNSGKINPASPATAGFTGTKERKKEDLKQLIEGLDRSCKEINNHPEIVYKEIESLFNLNRDEAVQSLQNTKYQMGLEEKDKKFEYKIIQKMIEKHYIENEVKIKDVYFEIK